MKTIIFILVIINSSFGSEKLEIPKYVRVAALEPLGFFVQWRTVNNVDYRSIPNYKIRLWEIEEDLEGTFTLLDGDRLAIISDERPTEPYNPEKLPKHQPREYLAPYKDIKNDLSIAITDIKHNTIYEVRVLAYRDDEDGPMSDPIRVKIVKSDDYMAMVQRESSSPCTVSVISKSVPENSVEYNYIEHVYL